MAVYGTLPHRVPPSLARKQQPSGLHRLSNCSVVRSSTHKSSFYKRTGFKRPSGRYDPASRPSRSKAAIAERERERSRTISAQAIANAPDASDTIPIPIADAPISDSDEVFFDELPECDGDGDIFDEVLLTSLIENRPQNLFTTHRQTTTYGQDSRRYLIKSCCQLVIAHCLSMIMHMRRQHRFKIRMSTLTIRCLIRRILHGQSVFSAPRSLPLPGKLQLCRRIFKLRQRLLGWRQLVMPMLRTQTSFASPQQYNTHKLPVQLLQATTTLHAQASPNAKNKRCKQQQSACNPLLMPLVLVVVMFMHCVRCANPLLLVLEQLALASSGQCQATVFRRTTCPDENWTRYRETVVQETALHGMSLAEAKASSEFSLSAQQSEAEFWDEWLKLFNGNWQDDRKI